MQYDTIRKKIKKELDKPRYQHTMGVMHTAACLAMRYGANMDDALLAGLLHDCAKCVPGKEKIKLCEAAGLPITEAEYAAPSLLHSKLGALFAKEKYSIDNEDVLNAIENHTTGRIGMSLLEEIVFVADYIEPGRDRAPRLEEIRALAFTDMEKAMVLILEDTLAYVRECNQVVDPTTEQVLAHYRERLNNR